MVLFYNSFRQKHYFLCGTACDNRRVQNLLNVAQTEDLRGLQQPLAAGIDGISAMCVDTRAPSAYYGVFDRFKVHSLVVFA